ncbi:MAG: DinB family protein [Acidobacteria bacterium]|nr:DinB family protein [Acidobacteriota bacterium]
MRLGILLVMSSALFGQEGAMSAEERAWLKEHMETSRSNLLAAIEGVTAEQWNFKPDAATWSIANVLEHLILTEGYFQEATKKMLAGPERPRIATANPDGDKAFAARITDRSKKAKAPEMLIPTNQWPTLETAAGEFLVRRQKTLDYIGQTQDPLRSRSSEGATPTDVYQYWILVSAHSMRHTAQIEELKAHPAFPKK